MGKAPAEAVDALVKDDMDLDQKLAQAGKDADALNAKLTKANNDLTDANTKLKDATTSLTDTQKKLDADAADLTKTKEDLAKLQKRADDLDAENKAAKEIIAKKNSTLKGVADALKAAMALKEGDDDAAVVPAVKEVLLSKDVQATEKTLRAVKDAADKTLRETKEKAEKTIRDLTSEKDLLQREKDGLQTAVKDWPGRRRRCCRSGCRCSARHAPTWRTRRSRTPTAC